MTEETAQSSTSEDATLEAPTGETVGADPAFGAAPVDGDPLKAPPLEEATPLLAGKYKSVEELEKGYKELTQHLRGKGVQPPETYELTLPEGAALDDAEVAFFKDLGLDNDKAQKLVDYFNETVVPQVTEAYAKAEMSELGRVWGMDPTGQAFTNRLEKVQAWATEHYPPTMVEELSRSASGVQAIVAAMETNSTPMRQETVSHRMTQAQIDSLVQDPRYWSDPGFREEAEKRIRSSAG